MMVMNGVGDDVSGVGTSEEGNGVMRSSFIPWGFCPYESSLVSGKTGEAGEEGRSGQRKGMMCSAESDETDPEWRRQPRHFFVLSSSGKPVWSLHGDENALAGFMAVIQALVSFVAGAGDTLRTIELEGGARCVVKVAGPLYLAAVSRRGEGARSLRRQLDLLHLQILSILTLAVERAFARSPRFDVRNLLAGTSHIFASACRAGEWELGVSLRGLQAARCDAGLRRGLTDTLSRVLARVQASGSSAPDAGRDGDEEAAPKPAPLLGAVFSNHRLLARASTSELDAGSQPDAWDLLLLTNFVLSSPSFREGEGFSPVCLPGYDARRFVYAYVAFVRPRLCVVLVDETPGSFHALSAARRQLEREMGTARLDALERDALNDAGDYIVASRKAGSADDIHARPSGSNNNNNKGWGAAATPSPSTTGLWHCCYLHHQHAQYTMPALPSQFKAPGRRRLLMRAYEQLHAAATVGVAPVGAEEMGGSPNKLHRVVFLRDERHTLVACVSSDLLGMCIFDPCTERTEAVARYHQISAWIRGNDELFAPAGSF